MSRRRTLALAGLALGFTVLNAAKPLHVDDAQYWKYAHHIASHPTDPYGFTVLWGQEPKPAISVLAPAGLPYWWALGMVLFGDQPVLWKLWLAPFAGLLVFSLHAIFRRFAPGLELVTGNVALGLCDVVFAPLAGSRRSGARQGGKSRHCAGVAESRNYLTNRTLRVESRGRGRPLWAVFGQNRSGWIRRTPRPSPASGMAAVPPSGR